jgi:hypothetical protein
MARRRLPAFDTWVRCPMSEPNVGFVVAHVLYADGRRGVRVEIPGRRDKRVWELNETSVTVLPDEEQNRG